MKLGEVTQLERDEKACENRMHSKLARCLSLLLSRLSRAKAECLVIESQSFIFTVVTNLLSELSVTR